MIFSEVSIDLALILWYSTPRQEERRVGGVGGYLTIDVTVKISLFKPTVHLHIWGILCKILSKYSNRSNYSKIKLRGPS